MEVVPPFPGPNPIIPSEQGWKQSGPEQESVESVSSHHSGAFWKIWRERRPFETILLTPPAPRTSAWNMILPTSSIIGEPHSPALKADSTADVNTHYAASALL